MTLPRIAENGYFAIRSPIRRSQRRCCLIALRTLIACLVTIAMLASFRVHLGLSAKYATVTNDPYELSWLTLPRRRRISRPALQRDEFFRKPLSKEEIVAYFNFSPSLWDEGESRRLEPMWACLKNDTGVPDRQKKLVFIHMSRSAGATIRTFFRAYAKFCRAGIVAVSYCIDLGLEYMQDEDVWKNGKASLRAGQDCILSYAENRTGHDISTDGQISTGFLQRHDIDILAGHIPIGSNFYWEDRNGREISIQYVVFFRHPLHKYVSEILFLNRARDKQLSIDDSVALINRTLVFDRLAGKYHEKYSTYLITPEQKDWVEKEGISWTSERRVNLSLSNIVKEKVLIGIVERMPQSIKLLEHVLDARHDVKALFGYFSSSEKIAKLSTMIETKNRTEAVVAQIRANQPMLSLLEEHLKYERQIYSYAIRLHERQYQSMIGSED